jgi:uncharacterized lipoprotein YmbA
MRYLRLAPARLRVAAALAFVALAAGCTILKPSNVHSSYYLLTSTRQPRSDSTAASAQGCVIRLRPIRLAEYLKTKDMAVRTGTNGVDFALYHLWAEPLDSGIERVLAENLRAAPGVQRVIMDGLAPRHAAVYTVSVEVLACEGMNTNGSPSTTFETVWQIEGPGGEGKVSAHGVYRARPLPWTAGDYGQLAQQLSQSVGDFSQFLVGAMGRLQ